MVVMPGLDPGIHTVMVRRTFHYPDEERSRLCVG